MSHIVTILLQTYHTAQLRKETNRMKKAFNFSALYIIIVLVLVASVGAIYFYNGYIQENYYIVNNQKYSGSISPDFDEDVHKVTFADGVTEYINYPMGYRITFPGKVKFDVSRAKIQVTGRIPKKDISFTITREATPYDDAVQYVADYENRFMMDPKFIEENNRLAQEIVDNSLNTASLK